MKENQEIIHYTLGKQTSCSLFARVSLTLSPKQGEGILCIQIHPSVEHHWHASLQVGIEYVWEYISLLNLPRPSLSVTVVAVNWNPVDTTEEGVTFAAARAFWKALDLDENKAPQLSNFRKNITKESFS